MTTKHPYEGFKIAVLTNGFVYVGAITRIDGGILLERARNIRKWGTTNGLGQLALSGPTSNTQLDDVGELYAPDHAIIHVITTDEGKWKPVGRK